MTTKNNKSTEKIVICVYAALFSIVSTKSGPVTIDSLCVQSSGYELSGYKGSMLALRANDYVMNRCFKGFLIPKIEMLVIFLFYEKVGFNLRLEVFGM